MEIYKIKDEVPEGRNRGESRCDNGGVVSGELRITELKQGVKNSERVNVYVDGVYALSLDVAQVVDYKVKVGRVLSEDELAELMRASEFGKLYQRALEKALTRPYSEKEIHEYLYKKIYEKKLDKKYINEIVDELKSKGYLDDRKFAEFWVENRFLKKGVSQKRLKMELAKKGVAKEIIEEVLCGRDDDAEIEKMIAKKRGKYTDEKLVQYLCRQGFSYDLAKTKVAEMNEEGD